jgi:hypothetical protein
MVVRVQSVHYGPTEAVAVTRVEDVSFDWDNPIVMMWRLLVWLFQFFTGQWSTCFAPKLKRVQVGEIYNFEPMSLGQEVPELKG